MKLKLSSWMVLGFVVSIISAICATVIPSMNWAKKKQQKVQVLLDLKALTLAAQQYAANHGGCFPEAGIWCTQMVSDNGTNREPSVDPFEMTRFLTRKQCGYAINSFLAGQPLDRVPSTSIVFYPIIQRGSNLSVTPENTSAFAWDNRGEMEVVDLGNQTRTLHR